MAAGDITYTNPGGAAGVSAFASGSFEFDVSEITYVICGFVPSMIKLYVVDAGNTYTQEVTWFKGMTAGAYYSLLHSSGAVTTGASGGPTVYGDTSDDVYGAGETATGQGFQVPAGFPSNIVDSDVCYWQAWR